MDKSEKTQELSKSQLDEFIDSYFTEEIKEEDLEKLEESLEEKKEDAPVEKSEKKESEAEEAVEKGLGSSNVKMNEPKQSPLMKQGSDAGPAKETADEGEQPKKSKSDEEDKKDGRPKQVSDVPDVDKDGNRAKGYDVIQYPQSQTPNTGPKNTYAKSDNVEVSKEDYEFLQKAKKAQEDEQLKKTQDEQRDFIKSAVTEANKEIKEELAKSQKENKDLLELVKSVVRKPQPRKSIANIQALEKGTPEGDSESFTKSEMLDAAEKLVDSGAFTADQVIELETSGNLYNPQHKATLEKALRK